MNEPRWPAHIQETLDEFELEDAEAEAKAEQWLEEEWHAKLVARNYDPAVVKAVEKETIADAEASGIPQSEMKPWMWKKFEELLLATVNYDI